MAQPRQPRRYLMAGGQILAVAIAYRAVDADRGAAVARSRPKVMAVERCSRLMAMVIEWLRRGWSPASVAAAEINDRPRKIHNWRKPSEVFTELLEADASTT